MCDNTVTPYKVYRGTSAGVHHTQRGQRDGAASCRRTPSSTTWCTAWIRPRTGSQYYYAVRAYANELVSQLSNVGGPVTSIRDGVGRTRPCSPTTSKSIVAGRMARVERHRRLANRDAARPPRERRYGNPDPADRVLGHQVAGTKFGRDERPLHPQLEDVAPVAEGRLPQREQRQAGVQALAERREEQRATRPTSRSGRQQQLDARLAQSVRRGRHGQPWSHVRARHHGEAAGYQRRPGAVRVHEQLRRTTTPAGTSTTSQLEKF